MDQKNLESIRHSCAHLLAAAVKSIWGGAKNAIGPAIEQGFYQDFDMGEVKLSPEDLPRIEKKMRQILKSWQLFAVKEVTVAQAKKDFADNPYKLELIYELAREGKTITENNPGNFLDLCKGGHAENPQKEMQYFKLLNIAGAYWRGDEKNKMLTRIYGTCFATAQELEAYLKMLEEAKKRDHRKLGEQLDLFTFSDLVGPGLPLWTPKGNIIREELERWAKETEEKWGYVRVATPHIAKHTLFELSGHLPYYKDDMYSPMDIDGEAYYLKGMNCPHHHMIFKSRPKSYRDLPLRYAEYGMVYRYEQSGTLFGLMRVRAIEQNDAHIYCTEEQAGDEFLKVLKLHEYYYRALGLKRADYHIVIGLPDEAKRSKYHGEKELWDKAERMMRAAIKKSGIRCVDDIGGAAFYGPKIDVVVKSSIGREFAISTNQLDLYMPTRFNLEYTDEKGNKKLCAVIHRAPLGSHERFIGFLIEHYAGAFPVWLAPVQVYIAPVGRAHCAAVRKLGKLLREEGLRVEVDEANETVGYKVRKAEKQKIPYVLVVGDKEKALKKLTVRIRGQQKQPTMSVSAFIKRAREEIEKKK